ncbi:MAG: glycosyl transferase group 1 [Chitinophagaceae bacterium]|nr:glycosyl transferase group 1 [Chitinophagaceae bacterium]
MMEKIKVTYYQRKPRKYNNFSLENYFDSMRSVLPDNIISAISISKFESIGVFKRIYNIIEAIFKQGDVNHITGDVHFLNYFLNSKKNVLTVLDCGQLKILKGLKLKLFYILWFKIPVSKSSYITTISTATKNDLLGYVKFNPDRIKVVPVCISPKFTKSDKAFNSNIPRILQIGVAPNKNIERLIDALENISCVLVLVGNVPGSIKKIAREKRVEIEVFHKPLSETEMIQQYKEADIITLVSTLEGFGMPIVEGNATGRVVITGNVTSMPEVAGSAAHLADPFSIESIREGFIKIITDEEYRNSLIQNGFENCKRFSNIKIAEQFSEIYSAVVHNK